MTDVPAVPSAQIALANERTFLAWIRTALALIATGVALEAFDVPIEDTWRRIAATLLILLGIAATAQAWIGWRATNAAAAAGKPIPAPVIRGILAIGVAAAAVIIAVGLLLT